MYCGQKLGGSSAPAETRTHSFTPQAMDALSGADDTDGPNVAPEPAPKDVGGYKLLRLLGAGGMGAVYEAEAPAGDRVAVKLLSSRLASNPSSVERFRQEGRLASQLAHPRCVFVLAADTDAGRPYIVMELMPGRTLKDLVEERGPLSPQAAVARTLDIIDGLAEAHRVGMIHRDMKPSNCFLTTDDRVKVGDFGLSKSLGGRGANLTQTGAFLGTVLFASPEQIRGEPLDYSSDVYSVAATLYYLLTGEAPFQHDNAAAALARAISEPPPRVRAKRRDVPAQLERVILKGLERDRARRWQTLDDLREALVDLLPERRRPARPRALVGAYFLDFLFVTVALIAPWELLQKAFGSLKFGPLGLDPVGWALTVAYFGLCEGLFGTTVGKAIVGLRVSRLGATGPPGAARGLLRALVFALVWMWIIDGGRLAVLLVRAGEGAVGGGFTLVALGTGFAALAVQLRRRWGFRGPHDFASGCHVTQRPLPVRKLRLAVQHPTPLEALLPAPLDALPDAVGGFVVRGRLAVEANGDQVWLAEDRALGRAVLIWMRPWGSAALPADPARPARLRRLGTGTTGWAGAGYEWVAYAAPLGGPLAEAVRPGAPLPWADARFVLEQLTDELRAAEADGSLPPRLALDHVWVEANGRVQVLDFPLCAARYRPNEPRAVLREAAALAIEGHPRTGTGAVTAPLPAHALAVLNRLFGSDVPLAEFQRELADTHTQQPEVTPAARAAHLGLQTVLLAIPLAAVFVLTFTLSVWLALGAEVKADAARRAAAVLADPAERAKFASTGDRALDRELEAAGANPRAQVRAADAAARATAEAETRTAALLLLQQRIAANTRDTAAYAESRETARRLVVREFVLWAGERSAGGHDDPFRSSAAAQVLVLFGVVLAGMVLSAVLTRGGVSMLLAGIAVVRGDGRPASRRQCAGRAVIVWGPVAGLLLGSALLQVYAPGLPYLAAGLFLLAAGLLPAYAVLALRYPARPPHDRFMGTFLVPG